MARKSNAAIAVQAAATQSTIENAPELTPSMHAVATEVDRLFGEAQMAGINAFWRIGELINRVSADPETYLTEEQQAAQVEPSSLLISLFATVYAPEQLRAAEAFFNKYPTERQLTRLLSMRCPDRPAWRLTTSHIQLLTQISDDDQRAAIEEKCAEEALTAKALATELQELRGGKQSKGGRGHQSPKGLKNQLYDMLQTFRRVVGRSESLWLGDDSIYDAYVNTPPSKREGVAQEYWTELGEMLTKLSDCVVDHIALYNRAMEAVQGNEEEAAEGADNELAESARRAAAAAAAARRSTKITR